jgi:hypothetical protein
MDWEAPAGEDLFGSCATGMGKAFSIDLDSCGRDQVASGSYFFPWTAELYCLLVVCCFAETVHSCMPPKRADWLQCETIATLAALGVFVG